MAAWTRVLLKAHSLLVGDAENLQSDHNMLKTIDAVHARIHQGKAWTHNELHATVAAGGVVNHLIDVNGLELHLQSFNWISNQGPCGIFVYENPFTDVNSMGVVAPIKNKKRGIGDVSSFTVYEEPFLDVNSLGEQIDFDLIEGTSGGGIKAAGGEGGITQEWNLEPDNQYLVRFINSSTNAAIVGSKMFLYEAH